MLTHVNWWKNGQWTRVSAEEAAALFPYPVSVHQKVFVCELCGQYVTFTGPGSKTRHFKHSRGDENKDCEERSVGYESTPLQAKDRGLPIVIQVQNGECSFLIGFPAAPDYVLEKMQSECIWIEFGSKRREYSIERFNHGRSTYFPVGSQLEEKYVVSCSNMELREHCKFPEITEGYAGDGRLFDATTGRMLPFDSDVSVGKKYYYYTKTSMRGMSSPLVRRLIDLKWGFKLYELMPTALDQRNAEFFLGLRARLTNIPLTVETIWPPVKRIDETIIHKKQYIRTLLYGDVKVSLDNMLVRPLAEEKGIWALYRLAVGEHGANVLIGRSRVLKDNQYLYSEQDAARKAPHIDLFDIHNELIDEDCSSNPPPRNRVRVKSEYDGCAYVYTDQGISHLEFSADQDIDITEIKKGTIIRFFVGNELEREYRILPEAKYVRGIEETDNIYLKLINSKGEKIPVSHAVRGTMAGKYKDPRVREWIRRQRDGIPKDALSLLISRGQ